MIDLLYLTHGRIEFTKASLPTLLGHTDFSLVNEFIVYNDSTPETDDATSSYVRSLIEAGEPIQLRETNLRSPVSVMNHFLARTQCRLFAKIDNDIIVPPAWLGTMLDVMERHPEVELLGAEPGHNEEGYVDLVPCDHIGGVGLMRTSAWEERPAPIADGRFGFTEWQHLYRTGSFWIQPELMLFSLDMIPVEPWLSLRETYIRQGLNRAWPLLDPADDRYWSWWTRGDQ
jgi:hypothetical protein